MDPFTQRMLERARARQEKIDQKLASSGQAVPKRKPLSENIGIIKKDISTVKSPAKVAKESVLSPKKVQSPAKSPRRSIKKSEVSTPQRPRNDVIVTKREFRRQSSESKSGSSSRNSDVSVEINIMHRDNIHIEVEVEEREAPIDIVYDNTYSGVVIKEIQDNTSKELMEKNSNDMGEHKSEKSGLRHNFKSRLDRLGNLYSDKPLSSPIHRTEQEFTSETPPPASEPANTPVIKDSKKKFGRLAALADQINNWEDDLTHHTNQMEPPKKATKMQAKSEKLNASTLDVSIHSISDINKVLQTNARSKQTTKPINSSTFTKPADYQQLHKNIVVELVST